jgi:hypothetical protein
MQPDTSNSAEGSSKLFEPENGATNSWPEGFFEAIQIEDAAFARSC